MSEKTTDFSWLQGLKIALACTTILAPNQVIAQITPDSTLPNNSQVRLQGTTNIIEGGTTRNTNLFHSFQEFSIPNNTSALFNNAGNIQNIFTRITGNSISRIDGLISANGTANLFLINPNGIIFGENARLDIGGSFIASTASAIKFADGFEFNTNGSQTTPLLTINVPIGLQYGVNPKSIQVKGDGTGIRITSELIDTDKGLQVKPSQTLTLLGSNISLEGATLKTAGGRIELGSVGDHSFVTLTPITKGFALGYEGVENFQDIQLSQQSTVDASGEGGGDIQVMGRNITLINGSRIQSSTLASQVGGSVIVKASESVNVIGISSDSSLPSLLTTDSYFYSEPSSTGTYLTINTRKLLIQDGAIISAGTFGAGNGGKLTVNATDAVEVIGIASNNGFPSSLLAQAESGATGSGGELTINTRVLLVQDGAQIAASTFSDGNSGNLTINSSEAVRVIGSKETGRYSGLFAQTEGTGNAGNLTINTPILIVENGSAISASTLNQGNGGKLTVNAAREVQVIGVDSRGIFPSTISVSSSRNSQGNSGDIIINTPSLLLIDGGQIGAGSLNAGQGGNLNINADNVRLVGISFNGLYASVIGTSSEGDFSGNAGNLTINTRNLSVENGARVTAATFGQGKGGNLSINADNVQLSGIAANGRFGSQLSTSSGRTLSGDAGNLIINTRNLLVQNGAQVLANTVGQGKGGDLTVNADNIQLSGIAANGQFGSGLFTSTSRTSTGDAGDLKISTRQLLVQNRAGVFVESRGTGNAGNLTIDARSISLDNNATLNANTRSVNSNPNRPQATININSRDLILLRGSNITTNATGENVIGGNININTDVLAAAENSDISANSTDFRGGNVNISTQGIFGIQFRNALTLESDITATGANSQLNGNVQINTPDVDPNNGLVELPIEGVDASSLISQNFCAVRGGSSFTITGRGGLPASPNEVLNTNAVWEDWELTAVATDNSKNHHPPVVQSLGEQPQILPAQGWVMNQQGEVTLIAAVPNARLDSLRDLPSGCQESQ